MAVWGNGNYIIGTATNDKVINSFTLRYTSLERFRFELDLFPKNQNDDRWMFQENFNVFLNMLSCFLHRLPNEKGKSTFSARTEIFKQYMGARNRVGIGLSYRPAVIIDRKKKYCFLFFHYFCSLILHLRKLLNIKYLFTIFS